MTGDSKLIDIPVLKAWNRIFELIACVAANPYNRDELRDAVLKLYEGKSEKSVFRGMAIPTLRRLGLIVGFEQFIRLGANGMLIYEAWKISEQWGKYALGTMVYEIDTDEIGCQKELARKPQWKQKDFIEFFLLKINAPNQRSARERLMDWIGLLKYCDLISSTNGIISLNDQMIKRILVYSDYRKKARSFKKLFITSYQQLVARTRGMQSHPIENLRELMALTMLSKHKQILTERQFDALLAEFPKTTPEYLISFGRPMAADEKLFFYNGKYYQTISIRFFSPVGGKNV